MNWYLIGTFLRGLTVGYPFVLAWHWMAGGLLFQWLRERHEPRPENPPKLPEYPPVSILLPCHNEEAHAEETLSVLAAIDYPDFEIIAINDGSTDRTAEILDSLVPRIPQLRVVHLAQNQGKSTALNVGALLAKSEILVGTDGDAMLERHSLTWFVRQFQCNVKLGGVTGNPRIRNRASVLGRLQVGEYSSIIGLIKRAETVYGSLFTVSGVMCAFRKRALQDIGWWSRETITDDVDASWRVQLAGWRIGYEPKAICWILMPETLKGLWRQRLRWAVGGTQAVLASSWRVLLVGGWRLLPIWLNYVLSILWAYTVFFGMALELVNVFIPLGLSRFFPNPIPGYASGLLTLTYILQAVVSVALDSRFVRGPPDDFLGRVVSAHLLAAPGADRRRGPAQGPPASARQKRHMDQSRPWHPMKPAPEHPWPPLISGAKVPWLVRMRDWLLTLLAWLAMAYSLRLGLMLLLDYFSYPVFKLTRTNAPDWGLMWERLSPFVYMILALVAWIIAWGVKRHPQLRRTFDPGPRTPPLPLEEHAASLGLDPREIERWRQMRIVTVHFEGDRIATARPGGP